VRFRRSELVWLAGNTFYGRRGIFEPAFLEWLERDFRLSDYELSVKDGRFHLSFDGLWTDTTMWELYSLSIINELRTRANLKKLSEFRPRHPLRQGEDQAVGQDRAPARRSSSQRGRTLEPAAVTVFSGRNM